MSTNRVVEVKAKAPDMSETEKLRLAEFYRENRDALEAAFQSASKTDEDPKKKLYEDIAAELTAMGVAVRTVSAVKQKVRDMKQKARNKLSEEVCNSIYFDPGV